MVEQGRKFDTKNFVILLLESVIVLTSGFREPRNIQFLCISLGMSCHFK